MSLIDFGPYKNIFSNLLTYAGNLQQELHRYASMKVNAHYNKNRCTTSEEKGTLSSFHIIPIECSAEIDLIANIINTS